MWAFQIRALTPTANQQRRMHWTVYRRLLHDWVHLIRAAMGSNTISPPAGRRRVEIIRFVKVRQDPDNLVGCVKPILDAMRPARVESGVYKSGLKKGQPWQKSWVGLGLITDDSWEGVDLLVREERVTRDALPRTVIILTDVEAEGVL